MIKRGRGRLRVSKLIVLHPLLVFQPPITKKKGSLLLFVKSVAENIKESVWMALIYKDPDFKNP